MIQTQIDLLSGHPSRCAPCAAPDWIRDLPSMLWSQIRSRLGAGTAAGLIPQIKTDVGSKTKGMPIAAPDLIRGHRQCSDPKSGPGIGPGSGAGTATSRTSVKKLIHAQRAREILRPMRLKPALRQRDLDNLPSSNSPALFCSLSPFGRCAQQKRPPRKRRNPQLIRTSWIMTKPCHITVTVSRNIFLFLYVTYQKHDG